MQHMCIVHCTILPMKLGYRGIWQRIKYDTMRCEFAWYTLFAIVTCFDFAYECIHRRSPCLRYFIQSEIIEPNSAPHCNFTPHRDTAVSFTGERLSQYHINIYWYCSMLILTLCSLILWNSVFISVCHRASEMQFYSMFFEHFYRKEHPIYCFMS